ncbi:hypothetical protein HU200_052437 [Digitaria exilis]|uniref:Uncharacterized protein n=1 Tax=Digitaria exilis TaxID=1010633 RepID=A0A835E5Y4_9POAL|nr:hypothetical protein HU200_052437 [Digitaria exilis]
MGRFVHLMATSLLVLVMISSNSPPSQAANIALHLMCSHPCFKPMDRDYCTVEICTFVCRAREYYTNRAYCLKSDYGQWLCCCPPPMEPTHV